jgi:MarR family transcriptional regulator, lower aerobic nicotinate degradation pathway regulator
MQRRQWRPTIDSRGKPEMKLDEMYGTAGHLLRRATQVATALFMNEAREFDLTTVQFAALTAVDQSPGIDVTRLSGLIAFDRSTLGGVVDRLETKGLLLRAPDPQDKRIKLLYLTPQGRSVLAQTQSIALSVHEQVLRPLSPRDRKELLRILTVLVEASNENLPASVRSSLDAAPRPALKPVAKTTARKAASKAAPRDRAAKPGRA